MLGGVFRAVLSGSVREDSWVLNHAAERYLDNACDSRLVRTCAQLLCSISRVASVTGAAGCCVCSSCSSSASETGGAIKFAACLLRCAYVMKQPCKAVRSSLDSDSAMMSKKPSHSICQVKHSFKAHHKIHHALCSKCLACRFLTESL